MAKTWQEEAWDSRDDARDVMFCVYCGRMQPWRGRRHRYFWPSTIYAECWPCLVRNVPRRPEPYWWRCLAGLVKVRWDG